MAKEDEEREALTKKSEVLAEKDKEGTKIRKEVVTEKDEGLDCLTNIFPQSSTRIKYPRVATSSSSYVTLLLATHHKPHLLHQ